MSIIGKIIFEARKSKGLTQEELAEMSNVNLRTIQRIENNESEPRGKTLNLICEALEINMEDVLYKEKQEINNDLNLVHGYKLASKGTRLIATLTEALIFVVFLSVPVLLYVYITKSNPLASSLVNFQFAAILSLLTGAVLYPIFSGNLGHRIFDLKVISAESGDDYNRASEGAIREFLKSMLSYLIIPMIWILWDDKNQNLYDKLTKTIVVEKYKR